MAHAFGVRIELFADDSRLFGIRALALTGFGNSFNRNTKQSCAWAEVANQLLKRFGDRSAQQESDKGGNYNGERREAKRLDAIGLEIGNAGGQQGVEFGGGDIPIIEAGFLRGGRLDGKRGGCDLRRVSARLFSVFQGKQ